MSNSETSWTEPASLLFPWDFPCKNTGIGCYFLLQGIFQTQGSNLHFLWLLQRQANSLLVSYLESPQYSLILGKNGSISISWINWYNDLRNRCWRPNHSSGCRDHMRDTRRYIWCDSVVNRKLVYRMRKIIWCVFSLS